MTYIKPIAEMFKVKRLSDFKKQIETPYRLGEFFQLQNGNIVEIPDSEKEVEDLLESEGFVYYGINFEDDELFFENGKQVPMVYGENK
jgi:hypothetical protein